MWNVGKWKFHPPCKQLISLNNNSNMEYISHFFFFIQQENIGLVIPWMLGVLTFMSLEAVATVYANILRDHINGVSFRLFGIQNILSCAPNTRVSNREPQKKPFKSLFSQKKFVLLSFQHFDGLCKAEAVSIMNKFLEMFQQIWEWNLYLWKIYINFLFFLSFRPFSFSSCVALFWT